MINLWFYLIFPVMLVDWFSVWKGWYKVRYGTKPLTLLFLIAWFTSVGHWQGALLFFGLGLIFSLLGDVFLLNGVLRVKPGFFAFGLAAFLLTHVSYIIGFNQSLPPFNWDTLLLIFFVAAIVIPDARNIIAGLKRDPENSRLQVPLVVYMLALSLMFLSALLTLVRPDWPFIAKSFVVAGAALFFTSDSVLAIDKFVRPFRIAELVLTITYHIGQILIVAGVLLHFTGV